MVANTNPIFPLLGDVSKDDGTTMNQAITAAAPDYTGIDADYALIWTSNATSGGYIKGIRLKAAGTNVATVARVFVNNGSTPATAANNTFLTEMSLPATTASNTSMTAELYIPIEQAINPGFRIYLGLATAVAAGWVPTPIAGQYE